MLFLRHPAMYTLTCDECEKYLHVDGEINRRAGLPVLRPKGVVTPCFKCPKTAHTEDRRRVNAEEPSARSRKAYAHYRVCKAVGRFPDDPIVLLNARIISDAENAVRDARLDRLDAAASALMAKLLGGG